MNLDQLESYIINEYVHCLIVDIGGEIFKHDLPDLIQLQNTGESAVSFLIQCKSLHPELKLVDQ